MAALRKTLVHLHTTEAGSFSCKIKVKETKFKNFTIKRVSLETYPNS